MEVILVGLQFETCLIYLDDTIVYGRTFREELERLEEVFRWWSENGIESDPVKVERVCEWPVPENATRVKSFLGLAGYYRRFVPNFASVARPLYKLTEANVDFSWTSECQSSFDTLKKLLSTAPNHGIGAVLSQLKDGIEHPVTFASRTLTKSERNYCVTRKELLAIVEFVKQFRHH